MLCVASSSTAVVHGGGAARGSAEPRNPIKIAAEKKKKQVLQPNHFRRENLRGSSAEVLQQNHSTGKTSRKQEPILELLL